MGWLICMRVATVLAAGSFLLAGCATKLVWTKPGTSSLDLDADSARCQYEANLATPENYYGFARANSIAAGINDRLRIANLQTLCMQAAGWRQVPATPPSPPPPPPAEPATAVANVSPSEPETTDQETD